MNEPLQTVQNTQIIEDDRCGINSGEDDSQFRLMFLEHSAPMIIVDQDDGGRIIAANNAACRFYGYELTELTSLTIDYLNIMPIEAIKSEMKMAKEKSRNYFNFVHRLKDGNLKHVEVYSSPVSFNGKKVLCSIILDSTEKKLYEIQLKDMNTRLNTRITAEMKHGLEQKAYSKVLLELNRDAVFVFNIVSGLPSNFTDFNSSALKYADGLRNMNIYDVVRVLKIRNGIDVIEEFIRDGSAEAEFVHNGEKCTLRLENMPELCKDCASMVIRK